MRGAFNYTPHRTELGGHIPEDGSNKLLIEEQAALQECSRVAGLFLLDNLEPTDKMLLSSGNIRHNKKGLLKTNLFTVNQQNTEAASRTKKQLAGRNLCAMTDQPA